MGCCVAENTRRIGPEDAENNKTSNYFFLILLSDYFLGAILKTDSQVNLLI